MCENSPPKSAEAKDPVYVLFCQTPQRVRILVALARTTAPSDLIAGEPAQVGTFTHDHSFAGLTNNQKSSSFGHRETPEKTWKDIERH